MATQVETAQLRALAKDVDVKLMYAGRRDLKDKIMGLTAAKQYNGMYAREAPGSCPRCAARGSIFMSR